MKSTKVSNFTDFKYVSYFNAGLKYSHSLSLILKKNINIKPARKKQGIQFEQIPYWTEIKWNIKIKH